MDKEKLIKELMLDEGVIYEIYRDHLGYPTFGVGHLITEKDKEDTNLMFPSSDDPTDEQVEKQCSDIVVNDITIPVEIPNENKENEETKELPKEEKYDNVDVIIEKIESVPPSPAAPKFLVGKKLKQPISPILPTFEFSHIVHVA